MKRKLFSFLMAVIMMFLATDTTALAANGSVMTDSMALESESPSENQMVSENGTQENQADTSLKVEKVLLSVNKLGIRVRAWSKADNVVSANSLLTLILADGDTYVKEMPLEIRNGYYTGYYHSQQEIYQAGVKVTIADNNGKTGIRQAVSNITQEDEKKVINDLFIVFCDGEGKDNSEYTYTGRAVKPAVQIYEGTTLLTLKKDYTLSYKNNKNAGTASLIVKGKGNYKGKAVRTFTINPKNISDNDMEISELAAVEKSKEQRLVPIIKYHGKKLSSRNEKDFSVTYPSLESGAYQKPGIYKAEVKGNGNYTGNLSLDVTIGSKLTRKLSVLGISDQVYTGQGIEFSDLVVKDKERVLTPLNENGEGDYTVTYRNNIDAGIATVIITGNGKDYAGTKEISFRINGTSIQKADILSESLPAAVTYTGKEQCPKVQLSYAGQKLEEGKDYTLSYSNHKNVGKATVTITGKGGYTGSLKKNFKILPFDALRNDGTQLQAELKGENVFAYVKGGVKPEAEVIFQGTLLQEGKDYTLSYSNNKSITTGDDAKATIKFKGNFSNVIEKYFAITAQDLNNLTADVKDVVFNTKKNGWKSKLAIYDLDGKKLSPGRDYDKNLMYYLDEACTKEAVDDTYPAGTTIWVKAQGLGSYNETGLTASYDIKEATIQKAKIKIVDKEYTGQPIYVEPQDIISVKVAGQLLTEGQDYIILKDTSKNNVKKGTATVTLKGINNYGGKVNAKYKIVSKIFDWRKLPEEKDVTFGEFSVLDTSGKGKVFFEKGEKLLLSLSKLSEEISPVKAVIVNNNKIEVTEVSDRYEVMTVAPKQAGKTEFELNGVLLQNGITLETEDEKKAVIEVLKDKPVVEDLVWSVSENKVHLTFCLMDADKSLLAGTEIVVNDGKNIILEKEIAAGRNEFVFEGEEGTTYFAVIYGTYDRDSKEDSAENKVTGEIMYSGQKTVDSSINTNPEDPNPEPGEDPNPKPEPEPGEDPNPDVKPEIAALELKDIQDTRLYYQGEEIDKLDITEGIPQNLEDYYVRIEASMIQPLYANVLSMEKVGDKVKIIPDLESFISYENDHGTISKKDGINLYIPYMENGKSTSIKSAEDFINQLNTGKSGTYTLEEDLDASALTGSYAVTGTFTGTLDGNGYTIYNLSIPLFEKLSGATVKNLTIKDAAISNATSILSINMENNSTVENCTIEDSSLHAQGSNMMGAVTGRLWSGKITRCNLLNIDILGDNTIGGITGQTNANTIVEDCIVTGRLEGNRAHDLGARVAGIAGWNEGIIKNCFVDVTIASVSNTGNGGLVGGPKNAAAGRIENSFAMVEGYANGIGGFDAALTNIENVYQYVEGRGSKNNASGLNTIENINEIKEELILNTIGLRQEVWSFIDKQMSPLPNHDVLTKFDDYSAEKKTFYYNMSLLAPYMNTEEIVKAGQKVSDGDLLTKRIQTVLPFDENGDYVIGLNRKQADAVKEIQVVFEDETWKKYQVSFIYAEDDIIARYEMENIGIEYHFDKYLADVNSEDKEELKQLAESYTYVADLDPLTSGEDRRLYKDYYDATTKEGMDAFFDLLLSTQEDYPNYVVNTYLNDVVIEEIKENLPELMYTYNYFMKWYDFSIGGFNPAKMIYFDGSVLGQDITLDYLTESVIRGDKSNTEQTQEFFDKYLAPKTGEKLYQTLEKMMDLAGYEDGNQWFRENFKGILREETQIGALSDPDLTYEIWDNLKRLTGRRALLLPVMTAPQEDMILVSMPEEIFLSSINKYMEENTPEKQEEMEKILDNFCEQVGNYFGGTLNIVPNAEETLEKKLIINIDTRFGYNSKKYPGNQEPNITEEPVFKWVNEAIQMWGAANGSGAYADGTNIYFIVYAAFHNYETFTHENAHNTDGTVFYNQSGRREGTGAEFHADGILAQKFNDGWLVFNITKDFNFTDEITVNLTRERVNTPEKLHEYYRKMFETSYVLDYLMGKAFLQLTPLQQSRLAVQVTETPSEDGKTMSVTYARVSEQAIKDMNLKEIEDLYDNKLAIRDEGSVEGFNSYYIPTLWDTYWYQAHNENGAGDGGSFKRMSQEMLGLGGYEDGFMIWTSGLSSTDLDALRKITKDQDITFKEYKIGRYEEVERQLGSIPYFNPDSVVAQMKKALETDSDNYMNNSRLVQSTNVKKIHYHTIKRITDDFRDGDVYVSANSVNISTAEQLVEVLKADPYTNIKLVDHIDFSNITAESGYYIPSFTGLFDGNGYEIYGLKYPVFGTVTYASFRNLHIDITGVNGNAVLAANSRNVNIDGAKYDRKTNKELIGNKNEKIYFAVNIPYQSDTYVSPRTN